MQTILKACVCPSSPVEYVIHDTCFRSIFCHIGAFCVRGISPPLMQFKSDHTFAPPCQLENICVAAMFGVSDHDLMFSQDPDDVDQDMMEEHKDTIRNKVAYNTFCSCIRC